MIFPKPNCFIGITVSDSATQIKPSSPERFNDVLRVLKEEKRDAEAAQISETFFARMLALDNASAANFVGLAKAFFQRNELETALRVLQLMIEAGGEAGRETALAEIAALETVKIRAADAAKLPEVEATGFINQFDALRFAAETALEFGHTNTAIAFRRRLLETNPIDSINRFELAGLLIQTGEKIDAVNLLREVVNNRNSSRATRFQARMILIDAGENAEFAGAEFDSFAQFYNGLFAEKAGAAIGRLNFLLIP